MYYLATNVTKKLDHNREGVSLPKDVKPGDAIDLSFNMKGKVDMVLKAN